MFTTLIYTPLYNGLILLMQAIPFADLGVAVIVFTIIVRLILFPLSKKAVRTQIGMKALQPQLEEIKKEHKDNPQEQAQKTFALYKEAGVNPFASIVLLFIQLPIIFGLYFIFLRSGFPDIQTELLYSFVTPPGGVNTLFLGFVDVTKKSIALSLLTGITQYLQVRFSAALQSPPAGGAQSFGAQFAKSMQVQMKYVFPVVVVVISYTLSAVIALYWITSNLFTLFQELYIRKQMQPHKDTTAQ